MYGLRTERQVDLALRDIVSYWKFRNASTTRLYPKVYLNRASSDLAFPNWDRPD